MFPMDAIDQVIELVPETENRKPYTAQSVVISFRVPMDWWWRIQEQMEHSRLGYDTVGDYMRHLLRTQAFRPR